jgi:5-methylcytosine-specific restriction endonuclease McrBC regulatory subunit McrC
MLQTIFDFETLLLRLSSYKTSVVTTMQEFQKLIYLNEFNCVKLNPDLYTNNAE